MKIVGVQKEITYIPSGNILHTSGRLGLQLCWI